MSFSYSTVSCLCDYLSWGREGLNFLLSFTFCSEGFPLPLGAWDNCFILLWNSPIIPSTSNYSTTCLAAHQLSIISIKMVFTFNQASGNSAPGTISLTNSVFVTLETVTKVTGYLCFILVSGSYTGEIGFAVL